jgi:class 3 adenylate cyclase
MDFEIERRILDEDRRTMQICMRPDPRRYHKVKDAAGTHYIDKFLKILIPADVMIAAMGREMEELPVYSLTPTIKSAMDYALDRSVALRSELLSGTYVRPTQASRPHVPFVANPKARDVVFLSIDIVGASAMRAKSPDDFDRIYKIVFREFGSTIGQFHGSVLKATGDGCIAYIDHPSFNSTCDAAANLGLSLLVILREAVNVSLKSAGLPSVRVRIGADFGRAEVREIEVPATGFSEKEVASDALNRAVKIEQTCSPNQFRVGYDLYSLMHVKWLERGKEVQFDGDSVGCPGYRVFRLS